MADLPINYLPPQTTDVAGNYVRFGVEGHTLQLTYLSHPNMVIYASPTPNPSNRMQLRSAGDGWRNFSFKEIYLSWDALPGGSFEIAASGNSLTANVDLQERLIGRAVDNAVNITNTIAQPVPVNDAVLVAAFNALLVTLATTALVVKEDPTPVDVDLELPAGATIVEALSAAIGVTATTILTVTAGKNFVARQIMGLGNVANSFGQVWVEDGASNIIWRRGITPSGLGHITDPLLLKPGYLIRGKCTYGSIQYQIHGYEYTP